MYQSTKGFIMGSRRMLAVSGRRFGSWDSMSSTRRRKPREYCAGIGSTWPDVILSTMARILHVGKRGR